MTTTGDGLDQFRVGPLLVRGRPCADTTDAVDRDPRDGARCWSVHGEGHRIACGVGSGQSLEESWAPPSVIRAGLLIGPSFLDAVCRTVDDFSRRVLQ